MIFLVNLPFNLMTTSENSRLILIFLGKGYVFNCFFGRKTYYFWCDCIVCTRDCVLRVGTIVVHQFDLLWLRALRSTLAILLPAISKGLFKWTVLVFSGSLLTLDCSSRVLWHFQAQINAIGSLLKPILLSILLFNCCLTALGRVPHWADKALTVLISLRYQLAGYLQNGTCSRHCSLINLSHCKNKFSTFK